MRDEDFDRLFNEEAQGLFAFLAYRTGDRSLAEDLMADAFERALRSRGRFDRRRGSARTWLYAIALNLLRDSARRRGAETRALERMHDRDQLQLALAALAPEERDAIALRFGGELTVPEIAELLGEPLTTVEGRVYRALRKLRAELG